MVSIIYLFAISKYKNLEKYLHEKDLTVPSVDVLNKTIYLKSRKNKNVTWSKERKHHLYGMTALVEARNGCHDHLTFTRHSMYGT